MEESKITCLADYDWNELGLPEDFKEKMDEAEELSKFEIPDQKFEGELEWRPTFKSHGEHGEEIYQGQWIKGTFTRCGFGRRSWKNILPKHRTNEDDVWYDKGYFIAGGKDGQCVAAYWL